MFKLNQCAKQIPHWTTRLADAMTRAGASAQQATELATVVISGLEGALLMARLYRVTDPLTLTADALATVLTQQPWVTSEQVDTLPQVRRRAPRRSGN